MIAWRDKKLLIFPNFSTLFSTISQAIFWALSTYFTLDGGRDRRLN